MWHTSISWYWICTFSNLMSHPNRFHTSFKLCVFCTLNFSPPRFTFFAFLFVMCLSLTSNLPWVFHYNTSKPKASNVGSSLVFAHCTSKQATWMQCSWSAQSHGFERVVGCGFECGKSGGCVSKAHNIFGMWCPIVWHGEWLGKSYTWCNVPSEIDLYIS